MESSNGSSIHLPLTPLKPSERKKAPSVIFFTEPNLEPGGLVPSGPLDSGGATSHRLAAEPEPSPEGRLGEVAERWEAHRVLSDPDPTESGSFGLAVVVGHSKSSKKPPPADLRSDAVPLDTLTDNLCTPSSSDLIASSRVNRAKVHATLSCTPKGPKTIKLPELESGNWKAQRDFTSELVSHLKRQGLVGARAQKCGAGLWTTEVFNRMEIRAKENLAELERRMKSQGIKRCERPNECLFCARWDNMKRCEKIYRPIVGQALAGGAVYLLTLTVPHHRDDPLHLVLELLYKSWHGLNVARSGFLKAKHGVSWWIRVLEVTFGKHGGHPHFHIAIGFDEPLGGTRVLPNGKSDCISERVIPALGSPLPHEHDAWSWEPAAVYCAALFSEWKRQVESKAPKILGRSVTVAYEAQDFRSMGAVGSLHRYLAKAGIGAALEMSYATEKQGRFDGRSVLELLRDVCEEAKPADIALWLEYRAAVCGVDGSRGRQVYSTSSGKRNPERLFEGVEVPPMPRPEPRCEGGQAARWVKVDEEDPFFVPGWLYLGLYRVGAWLRFTHEAERLGSGVVVRALEQACVWRDEEPPSDGRDLEVAVRFVFYLASHTDVPISLPYGTI